MNAKTLSARLRELQRNGLITRTVIQSSPVVVEYQLTKAGWELRPLLDQLVAFAVQYLPEDVRDATISSTNSETTEVKHGLRY
jgi:DNA-binding HxlR family transcriptional regulator